MQQSGLLGGSATGFLTGMGGGGAALQSTSGAEEAGSNAALKEELQKALAAAEGWKKLHAELHAACVDKLLAPDEMDTAA